jgi:hypothetical protein
MRQTYCVFARYYTYSVRVGNAMWDRTRTSHTPERPELWYSFLQYGSVSVTAFNKQGVHEQRRVNSVTYSSTQSYGNHIQILRVHVTYS